MKLCAWCQRVMPNPIARWNRWFCDDLCAYAWDRDRHIGGK